eukprot:jgi/Mesvir1/25954/Mv20946-RA.1
MIRSVFPHANIRSEDADGAAFYSPNHRPDIVVLDFEGGGRHLLIDVSVARPLALSHVAGASLTAGYTADRAERAKLLAYGDVGHHRVVPFVLEDPFGALVNFDLPKSYQDDMKALLNMKSAVDVIEKPDSYIFHADLPGMRKEDVKVQLKEGRMLSISGERSREEVKEDEKYHLVERSSGRFERMFRLPQNADTSKIGAKCVDGVLTITVPKLPPAERAKTTDIAIM